MPRALNLLRRSPHYRRDAFDAGLKAAGYQVVHTLRDKIRSDDVLVVWNRDGGFDEEAMRFEHAGARVLVAENGYLGNEWNGALWYSLALGQHAGAGKWFPGGPERWDALGVPLAPWRTGGTETLILAQRGIGAPGVKSPDRWAENTQRRIGGRIRPHPGNGPAPVPLPRDLRDVAQVLTWHSAAALMALLTGVPVWYGFDRWIGAGACRPLAEFGGEPLRDDAARLAMFQRMAWSMWTVNELYSGVPFKHLLAR